MKGYIKASVRIALATSAICLAPTLALASTIAQETFEGYTLGPLSGQGGGTGWTGNWTAPGAVVRADVVDTASNPLVYSVPGGGLINGATRALEVQLSGAPASQFAGVRTLATPLAQTFFVGYSVRYTSDPTKTFTDWAGGNNTFTLHLGTNATATTVFNFGLRGNTTVGSDEFIMRYATGTPVTGASTGGQLVPGTDYYLVAQLNWDGAAFTSANMWLNPTYTDNVDTPAGDAALTFTAFSNPITSIFWREAVLDPDDVLRADNLTLGTAWGDVVVVPEPSAFALAALGGLLLLGHSRRRK